MIIEGHTLPRLKSGVFFKPILKHPCNIVWFPEQLFQLFQISGFSWIDA